MTRFKRILVFAHLLLWVGFASAAYLEAGPFRARSCWQLIMLYFPPLQFVFMAIAVISVVTLFMCLFDGKLRMHPRIDLAWHGLILVAGLTACGLAGYAASGPIACL
ncbi:hypothetical protein GR158_16510 [Shinella sp. AETb1-6]|uniref:hypothetical protein n=1 Tax=Shinella sp. AETb1-6 TaxID=2692210 RepID=UPI00136FD9F1|nr:hypothetical protein [Shinella sp. AETb1-6]MXN52725.1 hypothetical protein [Shinella sp. AETb1-6]